MIRKPSTLADRLTAASTRKDAALASFEQAATALEQSAADHRSISEEAEAEITRLLALSTEAQQNAAHAVRAASKVRELTA